MIAFGFVGARLYCRVGLKPRSSAGAQITAAASVRSSATLQMPTAAPAPQAAVPLLYHVIVVVMENNSYSQVSTLPYISTLISTYTSFSQSYAVGPPLRAELPGAVGRQHAWTLGRQLSADGIAVLG